MKLLLTYLFLVLGSIATGQTLSVELSKDSLLVGEPFMLHLNVDYSTNDSVKYSPETNTFNVRLLDDSSSLTYEATPLEIFQPFKDTVITSSSTVSWIGTYQLVSWEEGSFLLTGRPIVINDSTYYFADTSIHYQLVEAIDGQGIKDIEEQSSDVPDIPFSIVEFIKGNWWWITLLIFVAFIIFLILRKNKKEKEEPIEIDNRLSLKQRTILAIDALEEQKLWEQDRLKDHFVELSYIMRSYLTSRYELSLLEKTTYETKLVLTRKGLNEETVDIIGKLLSQSDMVKFAKSKPDLIAILRQSSLAKQVVAETSPLDFDNVD